MQGHERSLIPLILRVSQSLLLLVRVVQHALTIHSSCIFAVPGLAFLLSLNLGDFQKDKKQAAGLNVLQLPHPVGGVLEPAQKDQALQAVPWRLWAA